MVTAHAVSDALVRMIIAHFMIRGDVVAVGAFKVRFDITIGITYVRVAMEHTWKRAWKRGLNCPRNCA